MSNEKQLALLPGHDDVLAAYAGEVAGHRDWWVHADRAMGKLIRAGEPFTADDFAGLMRDTEARPRTPNSIGSIFRTYATAGRIRRVGYRQSTQKRRKGGVIAVWRAVA